MKSRKSILLGIVVLAVATMASAPLPALFQEEGPALTDAQLIYVGIVASASLWLLRWIVARGYVPKKGTVAIALYVVSFIMAILFAPVGLPGFPPFDDAPSFVAAVLSWLAAVLAVASPVAGMAYLIYNILLKRVLESVASRVRDSLRPALIVPATHVRAKFKVVSVTAHDYGGKTLKLQAQYDASIPEDRRYAQATPSGELSMYVNNPSAAEAFQAGRSYYLDITPAQE